jgi:hypothetical protein
MPANFDRGVLTDDEVSGRAVWPYGFSMMTRTS